METASGTTPAAPSRLGPGADDDLGRRRRDVARLYSDGLTGQEVADELRISHAAVDRDLRALGIPRRRRGPRVDPDELARIERRRAKAAELHATGATVPEIAVALRVHPSRVYVDLHASGMEFRGQGAKLPALEPRPCSRPRCEKTFNAKPSRVAKGYGNYCSQSCAYSDRWWRTGDGISLRMVSNASTAAHRNLLAAFKSRWSGRSGRPREIDDEQAQRVLRLHGKGYSVRQIADQTQLSKSAVHRLVSQNPQ
jgi:DNA-binding CsgD family transcriptional regulator